MSLRRPAGIISASDYLHGQFVIKSGSPVRFGRIFLMDESGIPPIADIKKMIAEYISMIDICSKLRRRRRAYEPDDRRFANTNNSRREGATALKDSPG